MTATITPVSQYDEATLTRAVAGERMRMDTGTAPLKDILQAFADRDKFALDALIATIGWSGDFSVDPGGSNSSFAVNVGAISAAVLAGASSGYKVFYATATTIGAAKISGGGNLANSTWYYVYIWDNAGTLDYEISTTAPSSSRRTKTGDVTRRYLGCFRTTSAGAPFPMRAIRGRCLYRRGGIASVTGALGSNGLRALIETTATGSVTSLDLSSRVPPHARIALVQGEMVATSGGSSGECKLKLYTAADTTDVAVEIDANVSAVSGDTTRNSSLAEIELTSAQVFAYDTDIASSSLIVATVDVLGWLE